MAIFQEQSSSEASADEKSAMPELDVALDQASAPDQRIKKWLFILLKLAVSTVLIGVLLSRIQWRALWEALVNIQAIYFVLSFGAMFLLEWKTAVRLKILLRPTVVRVSLLKILKVSFVGRFYGLFLPAGVGYNLVRWYKMTKNPTGRVQFFLVMLVEQSLNIFLMLACVVFPLWLSTDPAIAHLQEGLLITSTVLLLGLAVFYLFFVVHPLCVLFHKWEAFFAPLRERLFSKDAMESFDLSMYCGRTSDFLGALLVSSLVQGATLIRVLFLFWAVGVDLPWYTVLWIGSLVVFLQALPISIAGIGIRESAFAYMLSLYGAAYELGALVGLLFLTQVILGALIGGVIELTDRGEPHGSETARKPRSYEPVALREG